MTGKKKKEELTLTLTETFYKLGMKNIPTSAEYLASYKDATKKDKRKAFRLVRTYGLATCEAVGILVGNRKLGIQLKKEFRAWLTEEMFTEFLEITVPNLLDGGEEAIDKYTQEKVNAFIEKYIS